MKIIKGIILFSILLTLLLSISIWYLDMGIGVGTKSGPKYTKVSTEIAVATLKKTFHSLNKNLDIIADETCLSNNDSNEFFSNCYYAYNKTMPYNSWRIESYWYDQITQFESRTDNGLLQNMLISLNNPHIKVIHEEIVSISTIEKIKVHVRSSPFKSPSINSSNSGCYVNLKEDTQKLLEACGARLYVTVVFDKNDSLTDEQIEEFNINVIHLLNEKYAPLDYYKAIRYDLYEVENFDEISELRGVDLSFNKVIYTNTIKEVND